MVVTTVPTGNPLAVEKQVLIKLDLLKGTGEPMS